jgi:serine/alanine adding enzyme
MELIQLTPELEQKWEAYVQKSSKSTFFHQLGWKRVIEKTFKFKPIYLLAQENNEIKGILPLFLITQGYFGNRIISLPFSTEGGVCADNADVEKQLIDKAKQVADENKVSYLELRQEENIQTDLVSKDYYYTLILKLDKTPEIVWMNADKRARNAQRKAISLGITVDRGIGYFDSYYKVFSKNMRDLGTPVDKRDLFTNIIDEFPNQIDIVVAKQQDKVIGGIFLIKFKNKIKSEWASSYRECFHLNPNELMYWEAIKKACEDGVEYFDFGRSLWESGTFLFKKHWGAEPKQLHYKYYVREGKMPDISQENPKRKMFAAMWSKLPLFVANKVGPWLREKFA